MDPAVRGHTFRAPTASPISFPSCYHLLMIIVANWKAKIVDMKAAKSLVGAARAIQDGRKHRVIVAPSAPFLSILALPKSKLAFAAQDISATEGGAQTGEVTGAMLSACGATYVIVGHSERRALGDTNAIVARKVQKALDAGLTPILCIGETKRDSDAEYLHDVRAELLSVYEVLARKHWKHVLIAYEPVWSIGKTAEFSITPGDLTEMVRYIRKILAQVTTKTIAAETPILYGGAVEPSNASDLATGTGIQGFLVGHASTDPKTFRALAKAST